ncbi:MAG: SAF domain-containing protein [Brachybacterium sp.]|uniref:SAF domain-containing protein n=1 Tax=Brachybacterium sp. TaxID=1891286 RepID=UPI0026495388|nr:SAF domain-containing protein [Brachybacterium sp.]MDN5685768.1 SAF domain-containing protein [Brachybacterium sp.]
MLTRIRASVPIWRRALRRRRRTLVVLSLALALALLVPSLLPPGTRGVPVVTAAEDLSAGTVLTEQHLDTVRVAAELVPPGSAGAPEQLVGREVALDVAARTPLLPGLLIGDDAAAIPEGSALMALPVPAVLVPRLVPGTHLDVLTSGPDPASVSAVPAVVVEPPDAGGTEDVLGQGTAGTTQVLVSLERPRAREVAHALREGWVSVSIVGYSPEVSPR